MASSQEVAKVVPTPVGDYAKRQPLHAVCMHRRIPSANAPALVHHRRPQSSRISSSLECTVCRRHWPNRADFLAHLREHRAPELGPNSIVEPETNLQLSLHPGSQQPAGQTSATSTTSSHHHHTHPHKTFDLRLFNRSTTPLTIHHLLILTERTAWLFDLDGGFELPPQRCAVLELGAAHLHHWLTNTVLVQTSSGDGQHEFAEWHRLYNCCATAHRSMRKHEVPALACDAEVLAMLQRPQEQLRHEMHQWRWVFKPLSPDNYLAYCEMASQVERIDRQLEVSAYRMSSDQVLLGASGAPNGVRGMLGLKVPDALMPNGEPCRLTQYDTVRFTQCDAEATSSTEVPKFTAGEICAVTARGQMTVRMLGRPLEASKRYTVSFHIGQYVYDLEVAAVRWLEECGVVQRVLFPRVEDVAVYSAPSITSRPLTWFHPDLNDRQQDAVRHIVAGTAAPAPYLLFGPPGTGKTKTLAEAILQLWRCQPNSRILVCAASNAAADELAVRIAQHVPHGCRFGHTLFRVYARAASLKPVTDDMRRLEHCSNAGTGFQCPAWSFLRRFRIVVCTLVVAGGLRFGEGIEAADFTHVCIDESGSSTELATLLPLALCATKEGMNAQIVLAGDPKQLGPVVRSGNAERLGLGCSLLERLMRLPVYSRMPTPVVQPARFDGWAARHHGNQHHHQQQQFNRNVLTKLVQNYRSHPLLVSLVNQAFYGGELVASGPKERVDRCVQWLRLPAAGVPIIFHSVSGLAQKELGSSSLHNPVELNLIMGYVQQLLDAGQPGHCASISASKLTQHDIGIISPYALQCQRLRTALAARGWPDIMVAPVESFQGRERPVILTSTVRSKRTVPGLGFLGSAKRLNVMLTRAQALLIMVGDPQTLVLDRNWRRVLRRFKEMGVCIGEPFDVPWDPPAHQQHRQNWQPSGGGDNYSVYRNFAAALTEELRVGDVDATAEERAAVARREAGDEHDDAWQRAHGDPDADAADFGDPVEAAKKAPVIRMRCEPREIAEVAEARPKATTLPSPPRDWLNGAMGGKEQLAMSVKSLSLSSASSDSAIGRSVGSVTLSSSTSSSSWHSANSSLRTMATDVGDGEDEDEDEEYEMYVGDSEDGDEDVDEDDEDDEDDDDESEEENATDVETASATTVQSPSVSTSVASAAAAARRQCPTCQEPYFCPTHPRVATDFYKDDLSIVFAAEDNRTDGRPMRMQCPPVRAHMDLLSSQIVPSTSKAVATATATKVAAKVSATAKAEENSAFSKQTKKVEPKPPTPLPPVVDDKEPVTMETLLREMQKLFQLQLDSLKKFDQFETK